VEKKTLEDKQKLVNKCPNPKCGWIWSAGVIGSGTLLEVRCKNRNCIHHMEGNFFVVAVQ
jgi:aspartate carbamoyltransferase regulatory subunit